MKHTITICMGSSCFARGNKRNLKIIEEYLARYKIDCALLGRFGNEAVVLLRSQPLRLDLVFAQQLFELRVGDGQIQQRRIAVRLVLLADARPDEDHPDVVSEGVAQQPAVGHER